MENEQTQKYQNFIAAQNFPEDPKKIPESEFYTLKIRRAYLSLCHENTTPGGNINYSIHMQELCFLYDEKAVPASRSEVQEDKTKWNLSHSGKRLSFIIRRISLTLKPIFTQGISEKLLKNGEHKSGPRYTFMWRLAYFELEINSVVFPNF